ncbi:hypothetical protein SAMN06265220_11155 [Flavobacterium nitrogenifigens]|uniref:Uncharacterized protein n=1 Tax=Flavobacterium nitrogenifigens TaxID=1617283 RepID=A0A521FFS4_9FLAO|nr:hypothetical protein SAMN06265220_11155 [Flavobacterium nitrogenifigens]
MGIGKPQLTSILCHLYNYFQDLVNRIRVNDTNNTCGIIRTRYQ